MSAEPIARDRILASAYDLFSTKGVRAVGIEEVIERAAVAKATLYRHFPSKDDLAVRRKQEKEAQRASGGEIRTLLATGKAGVKAFNNLPQEEMKDGRMYLRQFDRLPGTDNYVPRPIINPGQ